MKEIAYIAELTGSLKLTKNGEWIHNGVLFQNKKLSDLFLRSVVWDETEGRYYIEIGNQRATFTDEGCVYFAISIDDSTHPWTLNLSNGEKIALNPETLTIDSDDAVSCLVRGSHRVRFLRAAHQTFAEHVIDERSVAIGGKSYTLQRGVQ